MKYKLSIRSVGKQQRKHWVTSFSKGKSGTKFTKHPMVGCEDRLKPVSDRVVCLRDHFVGKKNIDDPVDIGLRNILVKHR